MVNVNKKYLDKELRERAWERFSKGLRSSESHETLISKLRAFLTPAEITMIEKRLAIPILVEQKLSYLEIGRLLDVSPTTISFVKRGLVQKPVVHKKYSSGLVGAKQKRMKSKYIAGVFPRRYKGAQSIL